MSAFRFSVPVEAAGKVYPNLFDKGQPHSLTLMVAMDGSHRSMAIYPYQGFSRLNFVVLVPDSSLKFPGTNNEPRSAEEVLEYFHDFPEGIKGLIKLVSLPDIWQ